MMTRPGFIVSVVSPFGSFQEGSVQGRERDYYETLYSDEPSGYL
jgi:hypothetical protein